MDHKIALRDLTGLHNSGQKVSGDKEIAVRHGQALSLPSLKDTSESYVSERLIKRRCIDHCANCQFGKALFEVLDLNES